ncbi:MAG: hypothetical protein PWR01_1312 [Clostridiales bacterium]|nr:hypothetical protein [Clostridiales bacterium]
MKHLRALMIGLGVLFLGLGLYSGEKIFFMGFTVVASLIFYALITNLWVLMDFRYLQRITPEQATKGDSASLVIQIHNDKPFIYPYIKVFYQIPQSVLTNDVKEEALCILPFHYGEIREDFICDLRGHYTVGITGVEVGDPFGLFTFSMNLLNRSYHKPLELSVAPRVVRLTSLPLPQIQAEGTTRQEFLATEEPASLSDIRQYQYGDPLKKIHWKISAKLQDLYVKNYETNTQPQILMFLETFPYPSEGMARYKVEDQMIECAVAVIHFVLSKWLSLQLIVYHRERQQLSGRNPGDFTRFFDYLAALPFNSPFRMDEILSMESPGFSKGESIVLIVHDMSYRLFNHLCLLKQSDIHPLVFLVYHGPELNEDIKRMIDELNRREIPCFALHTDERIDRVLERAL